MHFKILKFCMRVRFRLHTRPQQPDVLPHQSSHTGQITLCITMIFPQCDLATLHSQWMMTSDEIPR